MRQTPAPTANNDPVEQIQVTRSTSFVSLDTHPAKNSLVVTYEIQATLSDRRSALELGKRCKRDQLQIHIRPLDTLTADHFRHTKRLAGLDFRRIQAEIVRQCPMLLEEPESLENIQLHLWYLYNRCRAQLLFASSSPRPGSAALASARARSALARPRQPPQPNQKRPSDSVPIDGPRAIYTDIQSLDQLIHGLEGQFELFQADLNDYLDFLESRLLNGPQTRRIATDTLDSRIEALYGDTNEQITSLLAIRQTLSEDGNLWKLSSNRLLVSAILRTIQENRHLNQHASDESAYILAASYLCLIRLTTYEDVFAEISSEQAALISTLLGQLQTVSWQDAEQASYYWIGCPLLILWNLFKLDAKNMRRKILSELDRAILLFNSFSDLVRLCQRLILRDVSLLNKPTKPINLLRGIVCMLLDLSTFEEFGLCLANILGGQQAASLLTDFLVQLIDTLQTLRTREHETENQNGRQEADLHNNNNNNDWPLMSDLYKLELSLLSILANLTTERRLRAHLIRKAHLLNCVLKDLVLLLAATRSAQTDELRPSLMSSPVLLAPMRCLYALSGHALVLGQINKSRVVSQCLLELLIDSTSALYNRINEARPSTGNTQAHSSTDTTDTWTTSDLDNQLILKADSADYFIPCLWINLMEHEPTRKINDENFLLAGEKETELHDLVIRYFEMASRNIDSYTSLMSKSKIDVSVDAKCLTYIHLRLIKSLLNQFVKLTSCKQLDTVVFSLQKASASMTVTYLNFCKPYRPAGPMSSESLAIIATSLSLDAISGRKVGPKGESLETMNDLLRRLFVSDSSSVLSCELPENDELLLQTMKFVARLAQTTEICHIIDDSSGQLIMRIVDTICLVMETRQTDRTLLESCTDSLIQLCRHSAFLRQLSRPQLRGQSQRLVQCLSTLCLEPEQRIVAPACWLLDLLRQLEFEIDQSNVDQQRSIDIQSCRFATYNRKWLDAIQADSTPEHLGLQPRQAAGSSRSADLSDDNGLMDTEDEDDELGQVMALATKQIHQLNLRESPDPKQDNAPEEYDDDDDDDDDDDYEDYVGGIRELALNGSYVRESSQNNR